MDDSALAARQLMLLLLTDALTRSFFGARPLPNVEIDEIVDTGVDLWLRAYRARPAPARRTRRRSRG